jgi:hypothetical protein
LAAETIQQRVNYNGVAVPLDLAPVSLATAVVAWGAATVVYNWFGVGSADENTYWALLGKGLAIRWVLVAHQEGSAPLLLSSGAPESGGPLLKM